PPLRSATTAPPAPTPSPTGSRWRRSWSARRPGDPPAGGPSGPWPRSGRRPGAPGARARPPPGPPPPPLPGLPLAAPDPNGLAMVDQVTRAEPAELPAEGDERHRVVLSDFGARANMARG